MTDEYPNYRRTPAEVVAIMREFADNDDRRGNSFTAAAQRQAADLIDRLRAELAEARGLLEDYRTGWYDRWEESYNNDDVIEWCDRYDAHQTNPEEA